MLGFVASFGRQSDACVLSFFLCVCWALWPALVVSLILER